MAADHPKVLIVDDHDNRHLDLRQLLAESRAELIETTDGELGLAQARQHDLALIILNLQSPNFDGFEATRLLRSTPRSANLPIIMITDLRVSLADQGHGLDLGAVAYFTRADLDDAALKAQVQLLLDLHQRTQALQAQIHCFLDDAARLAQNNTQVRALQDSLHRTLLLDPLTDLPNRMYFDLHLDIAIKRAIRGGRPFAVAWIDLDHAQRINKRFGRAVGDALLCEVANRMEWVVRASDVLARVSGATFGVILDGVTQASEAELALGKLLRVAGESLETSSTAKAPLTLIPTFSVGVAIYPRHGKDRAALLHHAGTAAKHVFEQGGDGIRVGFGSDAGQELGR